MWVRVPEGQTSTGFSDLVLDRTNVVVSPGSAFGPSGEGFFRIALMTSEERLGEAAERIRQLLAEGWNSDFAVDSTEAIFGADISAKRGRSTTAS